VGVKEPSGTADRLTRRRRLVPVAVAVGVAWSPCGEGAPQMADLAYALLLIVVFAVVALTVRGLERL
jgi:hypothetical protein